MRWKASMVAIGLSCSLMLTGCQGGTKEVKIEHEAGSNYYHEQYRPQYHFSTQVGNLADPNGLIYFEGEYHLFHQKNGMWAHAVSPDLVHWEHMDIALEHDELGQAMSGSAVVDWHDSSGLFDGKAGLVAIYTSTTGGEAQSIAYSKDKGRTWERYKGNPVIHNPGIKDFRDPKVFWHEDTKKWVMVVSTNQSVTFYNSDNLIDWQYQSTFGDGQGSHVAVWECPDLFELPLDGDEKNQKWVLHVSIGDNNETNGSTAQYFIGEFDGTQFINDQEPKHIAITDSGQDFYAAQSFSDIPKKDGRRIWLGWMANWRYPYQSPTDPWTGTMSIPRELALQTMVNGEIKLLQKPIKELQHIRTDEQSLQPFQVSGTYDFDFKGTNYEFIMKAAWQDIDEFGLKLRVGDGEETVVGVDTKAGQIFMDRTKSGLAQLNDRSGELFNFGAKFTQPYPVERGKILIHGFVDESSVELFINDGETVFTNLIYTKPTNNGLQLYTKGGKLDVLEWQAYHMQSTWRQKPADGQIEFIVLNDEHVELKVGEEKWLTASAKPDWIDEGTLDFAWQLADENIVQIVEVDGNRVKVTAQTAGRTSIIANEQQSGLEKKMTLRVVE
ncbi:glycoside hydrolase family 32 protein [Lysinibacillus piscis]|uniref:Levanase n=1 Tax=Lysinibacillus piscis TaxID=2518931 RepID=A0ABQ5NNU0_9BACI|nr:glycoside hydrolase family 32 protein [Lysinibacillus sp. KH24]GLC89659.1 hypothetical protein LYSBPC_27860 [Lysinibacillus sp. KH24]